jgi:hypothetical protein
MSKSTTEKGTVTGMVPNPSKQDSSIENSGAELKVPNDAKQLGEILEIISKNAKLAGERTAMQNAIDELTSISFAGNKKITLTIEVGNEKNYDEEFFKTSNVNAIKLSVESLITAFKTKKTEIENSISLS